MDILTTDIAYVVVEHVDDVWTLMSLRGCCNKVRYCVDQRMARDLENVKQYISWKDQSLLRLFKIHRPFANSTIKDLCCRIVHRVISEKYFEINYVGMPPEVAFYSPFAVQIAHKLLCWDEIVIGLSNADRCHLTPFPTPHELKCIISLTINSLSATGYSQLNTFFKYFTHLTDLSISCPLFEYVPLHFKYLSSLTSLTLINIPLDESALPPNLNTLRYRPPEFSSERFREFRLENHSTLQNVELINIFCISLKNLPNLELFKTAHAKKISLSNLPELITLKFSQHTTYRLALHIKDTPKLFNILGDKPYFIPNFNTLTLKNTPKLIWIPELFIQNELTIEGSCGLKRLTLICHDPDLKVTLPDQSTLTLYLKYRCVGKIFSTSSHSSRVRKLSCYPNLESNLAEITHFSRLKELKLYDFAKVPLSKKGFEFLRQLPELTKFSLRKFYLHGFPKLICSLTQLECLDLWGSRFAGMEAFVLPKCFANLQKLKTLDLSNTGFKGEFKTLARLKSLSTLDLSDNHQPELTDELLKMTQLKRLCLKNCQYETIPRRDLLVQLPITVEIILTDNPILAFQAKWFHIDHDRSTRAKFPSQKTYRN